jgi:predicted phage terminase large subunit-like protein
MIQTLNESELVEIKKKRSVRKALARNSHFWFFTIYFSHYIGYPFAPFHNEMFSLTEDTNLKLGIVIAFRGSSKSTIMSLSYPIWAITGSQQKKFVLIVGQTQQQARLHLTNIKRELETNELLKKDIGPFQEVNDEWGSTSIVLSNFDARIAVASTEQSIRGLRHGQYRPDLVICDDVEDLNNTKTRESRDKTSQWLTGEVFPVGDNFTKYIIVGNLLHEDCLLMRLKAMIDNKKLSGKFISVPLVDKHETIAWPGKFPNMEAINKLRSSIGSESSWYREYLLKIISDADRLVHPEWIKFYNEIERDKKDFKLIGTGIDLAISQKDSADYTTMVTAKVYGGKENLEIYIYPNPVNQRLTFPQTVSKIEELSSILGKESKIFIEDVGYQQSIIQHLGDRNIHCEGVKVNGQDKRSRLALVTHLIEQGKILFPRKGAEELISQLVGFGIEKHDDLADAFSLLILKILEIDNKPVPGIMIISCGSSLYDRNYSLDRLESISMNTRF